MKKIKNDDKAICGLFVMCIVAISIVAISLVALSIYQLPEETFIVEDVIKDVEFNHGSLCIVVFENNDALYFQNEDYIKIAKYDEEYVKIVGKQKARYCYQKLELISIKSLQNPGGIRMKH